MGRWPKVRDDPRYDLPVKAQSAARHLPDCIVGDLLDLSSGPRTLIHSDLHSENLLLDGDRVVLLDWQNAALGHPALDVASVLCGTVSVAAQQALGRELLAVYEDALAEHGVTAWSEEALEAGIGSATRWLFSGVCCWLASYEAESPRDVETAGGHLERLAAGLVLWG